MQYLILNKPGNQIKYTKVNIYIEKKSKPDMFLLLCRPLN